VISLEYNGRRFIFRSRIEIRIERDTAWVCASRYGIRGEGSSRKEALANYKKDFCVVWDTIVQKPDSELSCANRALKQQLSYLVKEVL